ncbi:MAG: hypothetical protein ACO3JG_12880 [Luteolibacter sp.]
MFFPEGISPVYDLQGDSAGNHIKALLTSDDPCMVSRIGNTEMAALLTYLNVVEKSPAVLKNLKYIVGKIGWFWWDDFIKYDMKNNSGFFPPADSLLRKFAERFVNDIANIDVLGSWLVDDRAIRDFFFPEAAIVPLQDLEPFWHQNPWTNALAGRAVLVVHPFAESIRKQYSKRHLLFSDGMILPDFELKTVKAVQSLGEHENHRFRDWFDALDYTSEQIAKTNYDVAIIGAGAYGLPLASLVKQSGKKAVHIGGAVQLLFGITGKRWARRPCYQKLINEHWEHPLPAECPPRSSQIASGDYW